MKRLWLFNPENDIALANGSVNFTAPFAALVLRRSGEILPLWIAEDGDAVMCNGINARWLTDIQDKFNIEVELWDYSYDYVPTPWGWSKPVRREFEMSGFSLTSLPDDAYLDRLRNLSHRRSSVFVAEKLRCMLDFPIWSSAIEVNNVVLLKNIISDGYQYVLKSPWSSSGRGITFTIEKNRQNVLRQAEGTIRRQGSIMVERVARRVADFAMLFYYKPIECNFYGYSLFMADERGAYSGNVVAPQELILERLGKYVDLVKLQAVEKALPVVLREFLGNDYSGPIGVDMLIDESGMLHPVVELNMRWTMGFVSLRLARLVEGEARFEIIPGDYTSQCNPIIKHNKLQSGVLALNPPGSKFTFVLRK